MGKRIGIVGATGLVGTELITLLNERGTKYDELRLFASEKSIGKVITCNGNNVTIDKLEKNRLLGLDYIFFCSTEETGREYIPFLSEKGTCCIDNSSAFRQFDDVPLVIPEINGWSAHENRNIVANPNCSTIIALVALFPLHKLFELDGFCVSTYQAVSGAGYNGIKALTDDIDGEHQTSNSVFGEQILYNAIPKIGGFFENGYSSEEMKMVNESRKILSLPNLKVSATCVRIPVMRAHSMVITAQFKKHVDITSAIDALSKCEHVDFFNGDSFPTPIKQTQKNNVGVGRLRINTFIDNALDMWVSGDQIRKGAALNALQIFEALTNGTI